MDMPTTKETQVPAIDQRTEIAFERILLATDFSPTADIATAYAVGLARRFSSTLELTNVIDLSATAPSVDVLIGPALDALRQTGEEHLQRVADGISGVKVTKKIIEGFLPASLILEAAVESTAELIVLGTSSKQGLKKLIQGSNRRRDHPKVSLPRPDCGAKCREACRRTSRIPEHPLCR
jgi:nucleotide-binding universal stress UspA family protein